MSTILYNADNCNSMAVMIAIPWRVILARTST